MPFYDYSCDMCNEIFDDYNTYDQTCEIICPKCHSKKCKKIIINAPQVNMGEHRVKPINYRR